MDTLIDLTLYGFLFILCIIGVIDGIILVVLDLFDAQRDRDLIKKIRNLESL